MFYAAQDPRARVVCSGSISDVRFAPHTNLQTAEGLHIDCQRRYLNGRNCLCGVLLFSRAVWPQEVLARAGIYWKQLMRSNTGRRYRGAARFNKPNHPWLIFCFFGVRFLICSFFSLVCIVAPQDHSTRLVRRLLRALECLVSLLSPSCLLTITRHVN